MMFFVVVAYIKPVLYMENRLIQYHISRNISFNDAVFLYCIHILIHLTHFYVYELVYQNVFLRFWSS